MRLNQRDTLEMNSKAADAACFLLGMIGQRERKTLRYQLTHVRLRLGELERVIEPAKGKQADP